MTVERAESRLLTDERPIDRGLEGRVEAVDSLEGLVKAVDSLEGRVKAVES